MSIISVDFIKMFVALFFAQLVVFSGIFFMSGQLLPNMLAGFYSQYGQVLRGIMALVIFFAPANFVMSYCFGNFNPAMVTPTGIFIAVIVQVIMTTLVVGGRFSLLMFPAAAVTIAGCFWLYSLMGHKV